MKIFFVMLACVFSLNALANDPAQAPQDIIKTLAQITNSFTNTDGTPMDLGDSKMDAFILEKLKDPPFREKFINQTLTMHRELSQQLVHDLTETVKNGTDYWHYIAKKSGKFATIEFSKRRPYDELFESLHLLNLMLASTGYMTDFSEKINFREKIINELKVSDSLKTELNRLKKILIEKEVAAQGVSLLESNNKQIGLDITHVGFQKWVKKTTNSAYDRKKITMTLLEAELAQLPVWESRTFQMYLLKRGTPQFDLKLDYAKKSTYERINILNMAIDAHVLSHSAQSALSHEWVSTDPMNDFNPGAEKWVLRDARVKNAMHGLFARLSDSDAAIQLEDILYNERLSTAAPSMCSKLFD